MQIRKAALGPDHPETLASAQQLAGAYSFAGQWDASERILQDVLRRSRAVQGAAHLFTLAAMRTLAMNYDATGRFAESMALYEQLLRLHATTSQPEERAWMLRTFAQVCQRAGRLDRADELLKESLAIEQTWDDSFRRRTATANIRGWQAVNHLLRHNYAEAESLAREALTTLLEQMPDSSRCFYWMSVRGAALSGLGRYAEAEPLLLRGYEGMKEREAVIPPLERRLMAEAGERVVLFYRLTQQMEKASAWLERVAAAQRPN
jgi:tetratricopeptide (TPR) repeat protein